MTNWNGEEWKAGDKAKHDRWVKPITLDFVGRSHFIATTDCTIGEVCGDLSELRPLQTKEEAERKRVINLAVEAINTSYEHEVNPIWVRDDVMAKLYDAGMLQDPDKQVKPLSCKEFLYYNGSSFQYIFEDMVKLGHIIPEQG